MTSHGVALRWVVLGGLLLEMVACAGPRLRPRKAAPGEIEDGSTITLAESAPTETTLDLPDIPNADGVWLEMINAATRAIDLSHFYTSDQPPSRLTPIIGALRAAVARGVRVRFLVDESFAAKYPETLDALTGQAGLQLRKLAVQKLMGGVQHAKYMVIDRREAYLGSQNFDWRSLEHIQEMGVRIRSKRVAGALLDVFETDWEFAGGAPANLRIVRRPDADAVRLFTGETVTFVASPKGWLPDEAEWDLPKLVRLIDQARSELGIQLLTYKTKSYDGSLFLELDRALRRAAARGVGVRLLVSDWSNKPSSEARRSISALSQVPGVEVRVITIPPWSGGEIPFARVCHSKYLVVDGRASWVGTSNWEGDYFLKSRNVGVIVEDAAFTERLTRVLDHAWDSPYSKVLEPMTREEPPPKPWKPKGPPEAEQEY